MSVRCDLCDQMVPPGCRRLHADEELCMLRGHRPDTLEEKIGRKLLAALHQRAGIGDELDGCDLEVLHEIMLELGKIAVHEVDASR